MKEKVCVFDICGTLFDSNTTFDFLSFYFNWNKKYIIFNQIRKLFLFKALNKILQTVFHFDVIRIIALSFLRGYNRQDLFIAANLFYDRILSRKKNELVFSMFKERMNDQNCQVLLASATIDVVAEAIGGKIGCSNIYCSELKYEDQVCKGYLTKDLLGQKYKHLLYKFPCHEVFTDDFSDIEILSNSASKYIITYKKTKSKWQKLTHNHKWDVNFIEC